MKFFSTKIKLTDNTNNYAYDILDKYYNVINKVEDKPKSEYPELFYRPDKGISNIGAFHSRFSIAVDNNIGLIYLTGIYY